MDMSSLTQWAREADGEHSNRSPRTSLNFSRPNFPPVSRDSAAPAWPGGWGGGEVVFVDVSRGASCLLKSGPDCTLGGPPRPNDMAVCLLLSGTVCLDGESNLPYTPTLTLWLDAHAWKLLPLEHAR